MHSYLRENGPYKIEKKREPDRREKEGGIKSRRRM